MTADWSRYNLPAIYGMMQGENDCRRADRVKSWESITEAVRDQHRRLTAASTELAAVWSTKTESAQAFQRQLSGLALSMEETLKCAEDTRIGYRDVVNTLGEASAKLFKLSEGRAKVSDDLIPRAIDGAEDEYDEKAQQLMAEAEAAVAVQSANIKAPSLFVMAAPERDKSEDIGDPPAGQPFTTGSSIQATPVPVPIPHDPVQLEPGNGAGSGVGVGAGAGGGASTDPSLGVGPGLSGVTPTPPPATLPGPTTITPGQPLAPGTPGLPSPIGGGPFGGTPIGPVPGTTGLGVLPGLGGPGGRGGAGAGRQAVPMRQGLPSGAVIGQSPMGAGGRGVAGGGAAGRGAAGGGAAGRGAAGRGAAGRGAQGQMPMGTAGNRGRRADGEDSTIDGNPDERWEVYEGVAPVIEPDVTPARRDPGPGVFGIDR
jgi:hypothetical protein